MSKIQISNLQPAGVELFQGSESFLTELQTTEAHKIFGGSGSKKGKSGKGKSGKSKSGKSKSKKTPIIVICPPPPYCPPVHPCG
jgi:hypothetical protein